jgi:prepilin-type N-terminal cleavage/methylation domain-containing protein
MKPTSIKALQDAKVPFVEVSRNERRNLAQVVVDERQTRHVSIDPTKFVRRKADHTAPHNRKPSQRKSGYTLIELIVAVVIVLILSVLVGGGCLLVRGCNHVIDNGVKGTAEQLWEGKDPETD